MSEARMGPSTTLLIVDDREDNLFVLEQLLLDGIPGCTVIKAASAKQGFEVLASRPVDGALIDVQMPKMDGIEMCRRLKQDPLTRDVHVILLTARDADAELRIQALEAGADDFISKPVENAELLARVSAMMRVRRAEGALRELNVGLETLVRRRTRALEGEMVERVRLGSELQHQSSIVDCSSDLLALLDRNYVYLAANPAFCAAFGLKREQVVGFASREVVGVEAYESVVLPYSERCLQDGETVNFQVWFEFPAAGRRYMDIVYAPYLGPDNKIVGFSVAARDITELELAKERLRHAGEIISASPAVVFLWQNLDEWPVEYVSENVASLFGYSADDFRSGRVRYGELIHPEDLERVTAEVSAASTDGAPPQFWHAPYRIVTKQGEIRWVDDQSSVRRGEDGRITHYLGVVMDKTAQIEAEAAAAHLGEIMSSTLDEIYLFDAETLRFIQVSDGARQNLGYEMDELRGMTPLDIKPGLSSAEFEAMIEPIRSGEKAKLSFTTNHQRKDGSLYPVEVHLRLVRHGPPVFAAFIMDITEMTRVHAAMRTSEERFRGLFQDVPVSLWEEDFGQVTVYLDRLGLARGEDCSAYLEAHPEVVSRCAELVQVLAVNRATLELHGAASEAELGQKIDSTFTEASYEAFRVLLAAYRAGKSALEAQAQVRTLSGELRDVIIRWSAAESGLGNSSRVLVSLTDVSERQQAIDELRESRERLIEIGRIAKLGGWEFDVRSRVVSWTDELFRIHELPVGPVPGSDESLEFYHPDDRAVLQAATRASIEGGDPCELELRLVTAKGRQLWVQVSCRAVQVDGVTVKLIGSMQDVSERKTAELATLQSEAKLLESESKFRTVVEASADGILIADAWTQQILYANQALCLMYGCSPMDFVGQRVVDLHPVAVVDKVAAAFDAGRRGAVTLHRELACLRKDEVEVFADVGSNVFELEGRACVVRFYRDVADRRMAVQLQEKARELEAFNEFLVGREGRIIELKEEVNRWAAKAESAPPYPPVWEGAPEVGGHSAGPGESEKA